MVFVFSTFICTPCPSKCCPCTWHLPKHQLHILHPYIRTKNISKGSNPDLHYSISCHPYTQSIHPWPCTHFFYAHLPCTSSHMYTKFIPSSTHAQIQALVLNFHISNLKISSHPCPTPAHITSDTCLRPTHANDPINLYHTRGPFDWWFFACNLNSMETSPCCNSVTDHQIATNFCTCHDSTAVVPCTKFCSDHGFRIEISIEFELRWKNH